MRNKVLFILGALVAIGIAACGGSNTGPTPTFAAQGLGTTGQIGGFTITPLNGYEGQLSVSGSYPTPSTSPVPSPLPSAFVTVAFSASGPSGVTPLMHGSARGVRAVVSPTPSPTPTPVAPNPLIYITVTAGSGGARITAVSAITVTLPSPVPSGQKLYLAYWNGSQWTTLGPPGTLKSGTTSSYTLSGGAFNPAILLNQGDVIWLGLYEGTYSIPSPTPPPTPTPTPANALGNGDFESGAFSPWYVCYGQHHQVAETDPNPTISPSIYTSPTPGPDTSPTAYPSPDDVTMENQTPTGGAHTGSWAVEVDRSESVLRGKGLMGICQDVVVPATSPTLSLYVLEGGDMAYYDSTDAEGDIYAYGSFTTNHGVMETTAAPSTVLFSENNCYNNLNAGTGNSAEAPCAIDGSGSPNLAHGGVWREKGPYSLSTYAGQEITLFLGVWASSTSTTYYDYAYYDDALLTSP